MQKLLEETLLCDISSQIQPYEYGQKWCNIENNLKKIITKDNQINSKRSHKKLVLNLSKTTTSRNYPDKLSPKKLKDSIKLSPYSINQTLNNKRNEIQFINDSKDLEKQNDFIEQEDNDKQFTPQSKQLDILMQNQQKDSLKIQSLRYSVHSNRQLQQMKKQQNNLNTKNQQFILSTKIQKQKKLETEPNNEKRSSFQSLGHVLGVKVQNCNKNINSWNNQIPSLKDKQQSSKYNFSQWRKYEKDNLFQTSNSETNLKIQRLQLTGNNNNKFESQKKPMIRSTKNRAKTEHKYLQIKNIRILLDTQKGNPSKRLNENQNYKSIKSLQDYKNQINQLKTHIFHQELKNDSNFYKKRTLTNKNSPKSCHQKSIVFPLIERSMSQNKINKQKLLTTRNIKAFTFSQSRKLSQQNIRSNIRNQMMLTADKSRVQSIKLIVKKQKPSDQSLVSKQLFQEIDFQNNQQKGKIRKLKMSEVISGKFDLNECKNFKQNRSYLNLNRERNTKSCLMKQKQILPSPLNLSNKSHLQFDIKSRQVSNKRSIFFSNKNQCRQQKSVSNKNQKQKYSKQKIQKQGKQNCNKKGNQRNEKNISLMKIEFNKHQSKLFIVKK